jgi:hypothetical protein
MFSPGTKAIWLYFNGYVDAYKRITIIGKYENGYEVEDENGERRYASGRYVIKRYD